MTPVAVDDVLSRHGLSDIGETLREYLVRQRWFGGKERTVTHIEIADVAELNETAPVFLFVVVTVHYADGSPDVYNVPLGMREATHPMGEVDARHLVTRIVIDGVDHVVYDALADNDCSFRLWEMMERGAVVTTSAASLRAECHDVSAIDHEPAAIRLIPGEQSNTSLCRGAEDFLKWVRRIDKGPSVELEMIDALAEGGFAHMASSLGGIDYLRPDEAPTRIAFLQRYMHNASEGWLLSLTSLRDLYAGAEEDHMRTPSERRSAVATQGSSFTPEAARLGEVTAEMHLALTWPGLEGDVAPVAVTPAMLDEWATTMRSELDRLLDSDNPLLDPVRPRHAALAAHFDALRNVDHGGLATRIHGDYHLGQVLRTDAGWIVLDFEGEPARPSHERRLRWSPLRDVAGMLRSFDYAAAAALTERMSPLAPEWDDLFAQGNAWAQANRDAFWHAYVARMGTSPRTLPRGDAAMVVRRAFEVQKAVYEVAYELGHRPDWVSIPLRFLIQVAP